MTDPERHRPRRDLDGLPVVAPSLDGLPVEWPGVDAYGRRAVGAEAHATVGGRGAVGLHTRNRAERWLYSHSLSMTSAAARELAHQLVACADEADQITTEIRGSFAARPEIRR